MVFLDCWKQIKPKPIFNTSKDNNNYMSYNEKLKRKKIDNLFSDQQRNLRCQTEPLEHQHYHPSSPLLIWRNHIRRPPTPSCQCSCHHHCDVIGERSSGDDKIKPCLANISTNDYYSTLSTSNDYTNLCIYDNLFKPITTNDNDNFSQQHHSDCLTQTNEISNHHQSNLLLPPHPPPPSSSSISSTLILEYEIEKQIKSLLKTQSKHSNQSNLSPNFFDYKFHLDCFNSLKSVNGSLDDCRDDIDKKIEYYRKDFSPLKKTSTANENQQLTRTKTNTQKSPLAVDRFKLHPRSYDWRSQFCNNHRIYQNRRKAICELFLLQFDPFKVAAMDLLKVNSKLIVFSLIDIFTKLSPNKMLENYLKRLEEEHNNLSNVAIFNLSEPLRVIGKSSSSFFHDDLKIRIEEFGWPEKLAPSLECLCSLCKSIDHWLNKDRHKNIVILYSRRDLSRAALAIAVFLHYVRICLPDDDYFDFETMFHYFRNHLETYLNQSQKRFIYYFKNLLNGDIRINVKKYYLNQIVLKKMPNFNGKGFCRPFIKIYQGFDLIYSSDIYDIDEKFIKIWDFIIFNIEPPLKLRGEILIEFYHHVTSPFSQIKMFSFQFHTGTFNDNRWMFSKDEIDIVAYDRRFDKETSVEFLLNEARISFVQNVRLISELNFTKTNSYENFFIYQSPTKNVYHTKGPLDGSLYATVAKKLIPNHQKPEAIIADNQIEVTQTSQRKTYSRSSPPEANSKKNNEDMLDELLSEIFSEIQSFPDSISMNFNNMISPNVNSVFDEVDSIDSKLETNGDISYIDEEDEVTLIDEQKQFIHGENHQEDSIIVNHQKEFIENKNPQKENSSTLLTTDLDDYDNVESMKWLEKQQAKLRNKRNNKEYIEKRLIAELKNTIKHQNDSNDSDSLPAPEIPPRTSSRNLIKSDLILKNNVDDDNDDNEDIVLFFSKSNDQIDENDDQLSTVSSLMDLSSLSPPNIRSSTPSFPVRRLSPKLSSIPEYDKSSQFNKNTGPLFIKDTSSFWYKPTISREEVIKLLHDKPCGSFLIRDSNSFANAYGLAVKVDIKDMVRPDSDPIRHFLIESTNKGVQIKGCVEEPVFSSLSALVYQHSITRISLPTTLLIPSSDLIDNNRENYLKRFYDNGAACNVLYFTCVDVESLSGPMAIKKIIDNLVTHQNRINPTIVHFKASIKGITLTDNSHRLFFRKHFTLKSILHCSLDPDNRSWLYRTRHFEIRSSLFGFVAQKRSTSNENICLLFGHYESDQPSHAIVDFVNKLLNS